MRKTQKTDRHADCTKTTMFEVFNAETDETIATGIATLDAAIARAKKESARTGQAIAVDGPNVSMTFDKDSK